MQVKERARRAGAGAAGSHQNVRGRSAIDAFPVLDPIDIDPPRIVVDAIKDPMIPDPDPMPLLGRHLEGAMRARVLGKEAKSLDDAL
jgi:hypothetical protein